MKKKVKKYNLIIILLVLALLLFILVLYLSLSNTKYSQSNPSAELGSFKWKLFWDVVPAPGWTESSAEAFVNSYIENVLNYKIVPTETGAELTPPLGDTSNNFNFSINYNNKTGKTSFRVAVKLPDGTFKILEYKIALNGDFNVLKFIKESFFMNKTLKEALTYLMSKKVNVSFIGEYSNITVYPQQGSTSSNITVGIDYVRNKPPIEDDPFQNFLSSTNIINNVSGWNYNMTNGNISDNITISVENTSNDIYLDDISVVENQSEEIFRIINPIPNTRTVSLLTTDMKVFSIANKDYDSIKWYLGEKVVEEKSNYYRVKTLKEGSYELKVEIKRDSKIKSNSWQLIITTQETPFNYNIIIIPVMIIIILIILIAVFFLIKKKNIKLTEIFKFNKNTNNIKDNKQI